MDELYFVKTFDELSEAVAMNTDEIKKVLQQVIEKHWVKILDPSDNEIPFDKKEFDQNLKKYHFIATKAGLLAHNGR